ncbi:MAG TPA: methyltransferase domain-containing protein [Vicinamibacterales bacterium]|jgi:SAM-dependent methyltransferase|nr:methyltransferase domain-containing protein [Vicinamibacterales bacterium]
MSVDLYNHVYSDFGSDAESAVRRATYDEDIGQSSWMTAEAWLEYADLLQVGAETTVLEVGSGSGGPAVYLAKRRGCRVTGVDLNEHGIANGTRLAVDGGLADRATFQRVDASQPLPFPAASFDAVVSNDAMCHIANRIDVLKDWYRVLRPGGRMLFTDAMVVSGLVSHEEIAARSSIGFYMYLPCGENERLIAKAGFELLEARDVTGEAEVIARRWHDARLKHRAALVQREGTENFEGLQRFLSCVHLLSAERRLSRYCYLARRAGVTG